LVEEVGVENFVFRRLLQAARSTRSRSDNGQLQLWIGEQRETVHLFVFTLGYSRRVFAGSYRNDRLATLLDGHERAFRHFDGVTLSGLYDNPRNLMLGRCENLVRQRSHPI
jgi:transposase